VSYKYSATCQVSQGDMCQVSQGDTCQGIVWISIWSIYMLFWLHFSQFILKF